MIKCLHVRPRFTSLTEVKPFLFVISDLTVLIYNVWIMRSSFTDNEVFVFFPFFSWKQKIPLWKPKSKIFTYKSSAAPTVKACQTWRTVLCNLSVNHYFCKGLHFCAHVQELIKEGWLSVKKLKLYFHKYLLSWGSSLLCDTYKTKKQSRGARPRAMHYEWRGEMHNLAGIVAYFMVIISFHLQLTIPSPPNRQ